MAAPTLKDQYQRIMVRDNTFYRKYYHFFLYAMMLIILVLISVIGLVLYQMMHRPLPAFYAVQPSNQKMKLIPFTTPNLLSDTILRWGVKAATTAYTFDYLNYNAQLRAARPYFTEAGWQMYLISVEKLIDAITKNQLFVNGVVAGTPIISNQGPLPGKQQVWRLQIPFLVAFESANGPTKQNFIVVMTLVDVSTAINPQGIGIDQFIMVER